MVPKIEPPRLARLLDRQANLWEIRRRLAAAGGEEARRELAHLREGPWLTVSRQLGSGGIDLAQQVGERLGWNVYDKEILEAISRHTHARDAVLSRLDEREMGWLEDTLRRLLRPQDPGRSAFLQEMMRVVWALGRQGRAIVLGRGANWLLDAAFGLRVRTVAPLEFRAERFARQEGGKPAAFRARLRADDRARAGFVRQAFGRDIDDPDGYDLILNLGALSLDAAADAVVAALRRKLTEDA